MDHRHVLDHLAIIPACDFRAAAPYDGLCFCRHPRQHGYGQLRTATQCGACQWRDTPGEPRDVPAEFPAELSDYLAATCPRPSRHWRGLGDLVAWLLARIGLDRWLTNCSCAARQARLNKLFPFFWRSR